MNDLSSFLEIFRRAYGEGLIRISYETNIISYYANFHAYWMYRYQYEEEQ